MKLDVNKRIALETIQDPPDWLPDLLTPLNQSIEQIVTALIKNLTVGENMQAAVKTYSFTHGTELVVKNPLSVKPAGVTAIYCQDQKVVSCALRYMQTSELGLTVDFQMEHTKPCVSLYRGSALSVVNGAAAAVVTFANETISATTTDISHSTTTNTSRITINTAGRYLFGIKGAWDAAAGATGYRAIEFWKNNSYLDTAIAEDNGADISYSSYSSVQSCAAADYFEIKAYQNTGGNINLRGDVDDTLFWCQRQYNTSTPSAKVTLIIWGG